MDIADFAFIYIFLLTHFPWHVGCWEQPSGLKIYHPCRSKQKVGFFGGLVEHIFAKYCAEWMPKVHFSTENPKSGPLQFYTDHLCSSDGRIQSHQPSDPSAPDPGLRDQRCSQVPNFDPLPIGVSHKYRVPPKLTRTIGFSNLFWIPQVPHSHSDWHGISSYCQILKIKMPNNMSFTPVTPPNNLAINQAIVWGCLEI